MAFLKILVDLAACFCLAFLIKKVCEFLFYRYIAGLEGYGLKSEELLLLIILLVASVALIFIGLKVRAGITPKFINLVGIGVSIFLYVTMKWKRGDTEDHILMTYIPSVIGVIALEFIFMAR